ncbi:thioredoxin [Desulfofundulus australicus DSM 11792]|uniref:Thioredoxin n=1 Tax=Desulfofundulus australicus DSM 11792 TaxID=1121425 RepID=A0A1M4Y8B7_9FIRM|nr:MULTISPECIES: thioredoxin [Desulfofundulus]MDK2889088.1 thioredoxin 1 [Thermoanaerobacter sp.]SHF01833.1 thioredoxin [Desulfofundulus australicus DSM 11792]
MVGENIQTLTDANFKEFVTTAQVPVLVDFWAEWCGPCKMIAPVVEEIAAEFAGKVQVAKLNVDENQKTPADYKVISIPTLIIFKNGQEIERSIGFKTKREIKAILEKHL